MLKPLIALGFALALSVAREGAATPASPTPLSLDGAIAIALAHNLDYEIVHAKVDASIAQLRQLRAPLAPSVSLEDHYQYVSNVAKLSTPLGLIPFSSVNATNVPLAVMKYSLFDGGLTAARVGEAAAELSAAQADAHEARASVIEAASKAYYNLLEAWQMSDVAARARSVAHAHVVQARHLLASGMIPRADLLRAQAESASRQVDLIDAQNGVALAEVTLDDVLNVPLSTIYRPTDTLEGPVPHADLDQLLSSAHAARGELIAARFSVKAAQAAVDAARSGSLPHVDAVVSDGNTQPAVVAGFQNQFSAGLSAVWTLFDNGYTAGRIAQARAGLRQSELGLQKMQNEIDVQVRKAYLDMEQAQAQTVSAQRAVDLNDENLRLAQVRYRGGVGTALELQDAELRDRDARVVLTKAQASLRQSVVELRYAAGLL